MSKEKKNLLIASTFMIIYVLFNFVYLTKSGSIISKNMMDNIINIFIFASSIIGIIYYIVLTKEDVDLNNHSKGILFFAIIFLIYNVISGIFGFIVYATLDSKKKPKRELPEIKIDDSNKWICLISLIFCLFLMFLMPNYFGNIQVILTYIIIFSLMFILFRKQLVSSFKLFKEYFREYNSLVIKTWLKSLLTIAIIGIIIQLITNVDNATNQENLNEMFNNLPILVAILSMIYAPIVEELMFRGVFRKFINKKYLFILISGISFGALHVIDDFQSISELLYIVLYSALGIYLASLYYKTNNIWTNIYFHFLQNTLGVIGMLLLKLLG